jgi:hypothetical protein
MFSVGNATLVAIMQVGVIVAGILASGLWHKASTSCGLFLPLPAMLVYKYGFIGFAIPILWLAVVLPIQTSAKASEELKTSAFWFGVLILISLTIFMIYANVSPCFTIMWGLSGGSEM